MPYATPEALATLKAVLARMTVEMGRNPAHPIRFGATVLDRPLDGGLARAALHEVYPEEGANHAAATGFGLGLALRAAQARSVFWVQHDVTDVEAGRPFAAGLADLGADPDRVLFVRVPDQAGAMRAAEEALRCPSLGAVLAELHGESRAAGLTATRRLAFAASRSGVPCILLRLGAAPAPSAATTRWSVAAAPSRPLEANAPGRPAFELTLLRHKAGIPGRTWHVEWDRDRLTFADGTPLSRPVVSSPVGRAPAAVGPRRWRHAG